MNRYLIVSYDPDQQQWFYDVVFAESQDAAKEKLLSVREYCTDADALTMEDIAHFAASVPEVTQEQSEADLEDFRREIAPDDNGAEIDALAEKHDNECAEGRGLSIDLCPCEIATQWQKLMEEKS